jgi:hypothetical protein
MLAFVRFEAPEVSLVERLMHAMGSRRLEVRREHWRLAKANWLCTRHADA